MLGIDRKALERLKKEYPPGTRIELIHMSDPYSELAEGARGTVIAVDDIGTIHAAWDDGGSLGIVYGEDSCRKI